MYIYIYIQYIYMCVCVGDREWSFFTFIFCSYVRFWGWTAKKNQMPCWTESPHILGWGILGWTATTWNVSDQIFGPHLSKLSQVAASGEDESVLQVGGGGLGFHGSRSTLFNQRFIFKNCLRGFWVNKLGYNLGGVPSPILVTCTTRIINDYHFVAWIF